jgi:hypothetical protein
MKTARRKASTNKALTAAEIYAALSAPLDDAAYESRDDGMTAIVPAYRTERLNQVLGPNGWHHKQPRIISLEILRNADGKESCDADGLPIWEATVEIAVTIRALKKTYYGFGGWRNSDKGDALKGAATDALGKALSDLIGVEVYKGLKNPTLNGSSSEAGGEWIQGTLDAAYFSSEPATATIGGERMHLSKAMVKPFQRLWAEESQRQDGGPGRVLRVRWLPSYADASVKCIVEVKP